MQLYKSYCIEIFFVTHLMLTKIFLPGGSPQKNGIGAKKEGIGSSQKHDLESLLNIDKSQTGGEG